MIINLTPQQETWCKTHVANGDFVSIEQAARQLLDERIAEISLREADDVIWAKPLVDEALSQVAAGHLLTLDEHEARNDARLAAMKD